MKIDVSELLKHVGSEQEIEKEEKISFPEDGLTIAKPVRIKLILTNTSLGVLVEGFARASVELECSRCLKKFTTDVVADIKEQYSKKAPKIRYNFKNEAELKDHDFVFKISSDNKIDLTEAVRQNLLISMPIRSICSKKCPAVESGTKKKVDPRLEKLSAIGRSASGGKEIL